MERRRFLAYLAGAVLAGCEQTKEIHFKKPQERGEIIISTPENPAISEHAVIVNHDPRIKVSVDWKKINDLVREYKLDTKQPNYFLGIFHIPKEDIRDPKQKQIANEKLVKEDLNLSYVGQHAYFYPGNRNVNWKAGGTSISVCAEDVITSGGQIDVTSPLFNQLLNIALSLNWLNQTRIMSALAYNKPIPKPLDYKDQLLVENGLPITVEIPDINSVLGLPIIKT